jgi:hypothetical protein
VSFREEREVFAFASESELKTSPSDRLGDLEAMSSTLMLATVDKAASLYCRCVSINFCNLEMVLKA